MTDTRSTTDHGRYDAIVIGGGPAGSAYALTLARAGKSVLLVERATFPRHHIGESMLPYMIDILEKLGCLDACWEQGFVIKHGLEIIRPDGRIRDVNLAAIIDDPTWRTWTFQVERSRFDQVLLKSAADAGVEVLEGTKVTEVLLDDGERVTGVRFEHGDEQRTATARFVIDASGRAGVIARRLGLRKPDRTLRRAAIYKYFGGLNDELHYDGRAGDTQIGLHEDGWVWAIPIRPDEISVGAVVPADLLRASRPDELFDKHVARIERIAKRLTGTHVTRELSGEQNFEYHSDELAGPGYFLVGDAGCFTDPIFSAGVFLGLSTAIRAAEETLACLSGESGEEQAGERYQRYYKTGYETYYRLIRSVYDRRYGEMGMHMHRAMAEEGAGEREQVLALNGDLWSDTNLLLRRLRQEQEWQLFADYEPMYGEPV